LSDFDNPTWIDEQLRGIPLPPGILARLREIAALGDAELDRALGDVPVPAGVLDRLHAISSEPLPLVGLPLPPVELPLGGRRANSRVATHSPVGWQADRFRWAGWAIAAALLAMIGGVIWLVNARDHLGHPQFATNSHNDATGNAGQGNADPAHKNFGSPDGQSGVNSHLAHDANGLHPADRDQETDGHGKLPLVATSDGHAPMDSSDAASTGGTNSTEFGPDSQSSVADTAIGEVAVTGAVDPSESALKNPIFAGRPESPLESGSFVLSFSPQGVVGPRVKEYDLAFELRHGVHPFTAPAANAALRESRVPIWTGTASYELAWRMLLSKQLPPATQMHTEDFLAAMDYRFPLPSGSPVGIRAAGGPSPWGAPGLGLLQVGVQAGLLPRDPANGTNLVLVVDGSDAMRVEGRWELVRRAIRRLGDQMLPADRVSLVVFNQRADVWLHAATRAELQQLLGGWHKHVPGGSANVAAAVETAEKLAVADLHGAALKAGGQPNSQGKSATRVVLLADAAAPLSGKPLVQAKELVKQSVAAGMPWEVINVRQDELLDDGWNDLASTGGGAVRHASSPEGLYQRLLKALAGRSQVVAGSVSMKVEFRPDAVVRYRLIGHDATGAGGLSGGPLEADLLSGQAATALYEVELAADGPERVATVEVTWREPGSERLFRTRQEISRLEFAPSWRESPLPLQLAALAAETGEILRGSPFVPPASQPLEQVAKLAAQANPKLLERPDFQRLKQFIELARSARQRGAARIDAP
jgi:Ca-activated chloride channel family protein